MKLVGKNSKKIYNCEIDPDYTYNGEVYIKIFVKNSKGVNTFIHYRLDYINDNCDSNFIKLKEYRKLKLEKINESRG